MEDNGDELEEEKIELEHHKQQSLCTTRAAYRQGRKLTAVKTYTVNSESIYLLIFGVPKINLRPELKNLCQKYGQIKNLTYCEEYPTEDFTECFRVKYERIQSARIAKRMIDTKNFFGGSLHVCYAPEFETLDETRAKLMQRRLDVAKRLKMNKRDEMSAKNDVKVVQNNASLIYSDANQAVGGCSVNNEALIDPGSGLCMNSDSFIDPKSDLYVNSQSVGYTSGSNVNNKDFTNCSSELNVNNKGFVDSVAARSGLNVNNEWFIGSNASESGFNTNLDTTINKKVIVQPEYVFKRKIKKRNKNLDKEIQKIKMSVREIGPGLNEKETSKKDVEAVLGRVVVCEQIESPRIVKIKHKPMNKIIFNINNPKL